MHFGDGALEMRISGGWNVVVRVNLLHFMKAAPSVGHSQTAYTFHLQKEVDGPWAVKPQVINIRLPSRTKAQLLIWTGGELLHFYLL